MTFMPCFFLLSGIFLKKDTGWREFIIKKAKSLLLPCFFTYIVSFLLIYGIGIVVPRMIINNLDFLDIVYSRMFGNGVVWFLLALFWAEIVVKLALTINSTWVQFLFILSTSLLGYNFNSLFNIRLPFFIDSALTASIFVYAGHKLKFFILNEPKRYIIPLTIFSFGISVFFNVSVDMRANLYKGEYAVWLIVILIGCLSIILLSKLISGNRILEFIGRGTLEILCFHYFIVRIFCVVFAKMGYSNIGMLLIMYLLVVITSMELVPLLRKILPFIFVTPSK